MNAAQFALVILAGAAFFIFLPAAVMYNRLVRLKNFCRESWSDIDTELKRRYDLIPNLVSAVKAYAAHEKELFENIAKARSAAIANSGSPASQAKDENALIVSLRQVLAVAENYPVLKANENFLHLHKELVNTEERIQRARRFYNANVRDLNTCLEVFPSNLVAGFFHFEKSEFFEIDDAVRQSVPSVG